MVSTFIVAMLLLAVRFARSFQGLRFWNREAGGWIRSGRIQRHASQGTQHSRRALEGGIMVRAERAERASGEGVSDCLPARSQSRSRLEKTGLFEAEGQVDDACEDRCRAL